MCKRAKQLPNVQRNVLIQLIMSYNLDVKKIVYYFVFQYFDGLP
jgi:hypothetical protein